MTNTNAQLLLASCNAVTGDILYTWKLTFPRIILAEVNTHRVASRNTSSSRAIPTRKQRERVLDDPFVPKHIGQNQAGMQAGDALPEWKRWSIEQIWKLCRYPAVAGAWAMEKLGAHKQIPNRLLEPWMWTEQVFSATELDNFFQLRDHWMAEPHFQELARQMHMQTQFVRTMLTVEMKPRTLLWYNGAKDPLWECKINVLQPGEWHLPFIDESDEHNLSLDTAKKVSAARCARVSYFLPENGKRSTTGRDLELFNRLAVRKNGDNDPVHLSPLEHQAQAIDQSVFIGNLKGFRQFRKEIPNEVGRV